MKMSDEAFITLATTNSYCKGATVVASSLRRHGTTRKIIAMVTPNISEKSRLGLESVFDEVLLVDVMDSEDRLHLSMLGRPELGITFTKIHCWTLTQYSKCVFLDADTMVLSNVDELFEREELSAAPDPGWPDCFNSGVFVFRPSLHTHARLLDHALQHGSYDGGDQGLLNSFFSSWPLADITKHLPFVYNLSASSIYSYLPAFQQFGHNAKIVHFLGGTKPWSSRPRDVNNSNTMGRFMSLWWKEYQSQTKPTPPGNQHAQDWDKPQQIQEQDAKMPFRDNVDRSNSLLTHLLPPTEEPHPPFEPKMGSGTDNTRFEEDTSAREDAQIQDSPPGAEDLAINKTATDPEADREQEELERRTLWENGKADYLGKDAFQNIQKMLDCFLD
ncbi:glycogenin-2 isoform X2 [Limanda limanda]|uniref:glycogenin-2 isoform X2 n=1 Tax=Limanda limanda TaxID=27771 RepID=UPI0029C93DDF|nr:glycogenin-2 isoform X2 [Limanda limanda]